MKTTLRNLWSAVVVVGLCAACGGSGGSGTDGSTSHVSGRVTDKQGTQAQSLTVHAEQLGGSGTVAATATVRVSTVSQNGTLTTAAEGKLDAQGSYSLDVLDSSDPLVIQALDASGKVLAQAALEQAPQGQTTTAPPMDEESSLEASVFLQALADKSSSEAVNLVDLRSRINSNMAAAQQGAATADTYQAQVKALADAVRAAQQTQVNMYAKAGVQTSQTALFQAEVSAAASLNTSLDAAVAAGSSTQQAYEQFAADLEAAAQKVGTTVQQQAEAERAASASFRATVQVRLSADAQALKDASERASASLEARATAEAVNAILAAGSAADNVKQQASTTGATLRAQVSAAMSAGAAAQAFSSFDATVSGSADVQTSVVGQYTGLTLATQLSGALRVSQAAAGTLNTALSAAAAAAITANSTNVSLLASTMADAFQAYSTTVTAQATALTALGFGAKASPTVELLVVANGSFQLGQ